jgi:outer membrane receptor protein involved in Fe transport
VGHPSRLLVLLLAVLLTPIAGAAEPQLRGRVLDRETRRPISRAEVSILGYPGERLTDADGRFTWQPAPPPPFELLIVLPGGRYTRPVLVERIADQVMDILVESLFTETLTVAAGAAPTIQSTPGSGTTTVTSGEMRARAPTTLAQALENVAGVSTVSEGHAAVPAVRGFSAGRTLILLDGARVTSERRVGPSASFLDPFVLEAVEVARGPGSVAYGSDAFGGVIAARTRRVAPGAPLTLRALAVGGIGIPEWRGGVEMSRGLARGGMLFQAHLRQFDDYRSPAGRVSNSGARDRGLLARVEHAAGPGSLTLSVQSDFGRDIARPRNNSHVVRFYHPREESHRFTAGYEMTQVAGFERITATVFTGRYGVVTDQDRAATATSARSIERAEVSARDFHVRLIGERGLGRAHLATGADISGRYGLEAFEDRVVFDPAGAHVRTDRTIAVETARRTDAGLFATIQAPLGRRALLGGGLRGDRVTTSNRGGYFGDRRDSQTAGSGYGSVTMGLPRGITLTAQAARGFRDALLSDRYYRGPTGRGFITGNPDLAPETSLQFDGGLRYTTGRMRMAAYVFDYRIASLIERYQPLLDTFFFRNRGRARMRGFELEAQAAFEDGFSVQLAAQLTRGRVLDDGTPLDGVPAASLSVQLRRALARGFLETRLAGYARHTRPGPTERTTPGYALVDVSGGWTLSPALELRALGRNVLNQEYLVSADTRTVAAPGASLTVTLEVKVNRGDAKGQ